MEKFRKEIAFERVCGRFIYAPRIVIAWVAISLSNAAFAEVTRRILSQKNTRTMHDGNNTIQITVGSHISSRYGDRDVRIVWCGYNVRVYSIRRR